MPIRLSGINSGLDTDALIKELVSAYSLKTEKYEKQKTKIEWKKEAWQGLNTKIYGLYTSISNLRYDSAYNLKKTSVSDSTKARITASSTAVTGTQKLQVVDTAQASYLTGGKLGEDVTSKSKMSDLGYTGGETTIEVRSEAGGTKSITITGDTTISEFVTKLKDEAGLNASFDEINGRFFISAKESGAAYDFDLCTTDTNGQDALTKLGLNLSLFEYDTQGQVVFSSAGSAYEDAYDLYVNAIGDKTITKDEDAVNEIKTYLNNRVSEYKTQIEAQNAIIKNQDYNAAIERYNEEYKGLVAKRDAKSAYDTIYNAVEEIGLSEEQVYELVKKCASDDDITVEKLKEYLGTDVSLTDEKIEELATVLEENIKKVNDYEGDDLLSIDVESVDASINQIKADYDTAVAEIAAAEQEIVNIKKFEYGNLIDLDEEAFNAKVTELSTQAIEAKKLWDNKEVTEDAAIKIAGQDAKIILNGAEFTSSNNSFSINGLTIEALAETDHEIAITTAVDTQGIYDKVKDFLTQYNSVINEITKLYNADTAKGYEPLTDEERDAMSESEIEKWESKIKNSLLRRDNSLGSVMNAMINSMSKTYEVNGKTLSLGNFGISTLGFMNAAVNEQYAYHIDGDEDDANTSGKPDKLMKAIQEDPDQIIGFLKQLTDGLYKAVDDKMKSTELSSVYKVYNDKEIDKEIKSIEDLIKKWKEKVEAEEDRYYKQFSQMESALSKLQSQSNSLAGLLGQ